MGGDGIGGGDGVLKEKSSGVIGERLLRLRLEKIPWKYLRLGMSKEDDNLKVVSGSNFIKRKWFKSGMG
uniref:Uncharacterized protein n=1 Tax=Tanacetum cinerariifolium TaxID=118510 RepID=A0A6L2K7N9_TANCI|nr:hypothetical protein [Tanacetum cinerariifolium]